MEDEESYSSGCCGSSGLGWMGAPDQPAGIHGWSLCLYYQTLESSFPQLARAPGIPGWLCLLPALPGNLDSSVGARLPLPCYASNLTKPTWSAVQPLLQSTLIPPNHGNAHWHSPDKFPPFSGSVFGNKDYSGKLNLEASSAWSHHTATWMWSHPRMTIYSAESQVVRRTRAPSVLGDSTFTQCASPLPWTKMGEHKI